MLKRNLIIATAMVLSAGGGYLLGTYIESRKTNNRINEELQKNDKYWRQKINALKNKKQDMKSDTENVNKEEISHRKHNCAANDDVTVTTTVVNNNNDSEDEDIYKIDVNDYGEDCYDTATIYYNPEIDQFFDDDHNTFSLIHEFSNKLNVEKVKTLVHNHFNSEDVTESLFFRHFSGGMDYEIMLTDWDTEDNSDEKETDPDDEY